jgi:hypothetical protein
MAPAQIIQQCTPSASAPPTSDGALRQLQKLLQAAADSAATVADGIALSPEPMLWASGDVLHALRPAAGGLLATDGMPDPELGPFFVEDPELEVSVAVLRLGEC